MRATTAMISQDPPVLETSDRVLDAGSTSTMSTPGSVAQNPVAAKRRGDELRDAAIAAIGKDATVLLAACLDARASVVYRVVAVAWTARRGGDNPQVASAEDRKSTRL